MKIRKRKDPACFDTSLSHIARCCNPAGLMQHLHFFYRASEFRSLKANITVLSDLHFTLKRCGVNNWYSAHSNFLPKYFPGIKLESQVLGKIHDPKI